MTTTTHIAAPESFYVMQDLVRLHARYEQTGGAHRSYAPPRPGEC